MQSAMEHATAPAHPCDKSVAFLMSELAQRGVEVPFHDFLAPESDIAKTLAACLFVVKNILYHAHMGITQLAEDPVHNMEKVDEWLRQAHVLFKYEIDGLCSTASRSGTTLLTKSEREWLDGLSSTLSVSTSPYSHETTLPLEKLTGGICVLKDSLTPLLRRYVIETRDMSVVCMLFRMRALHISSCFLAFLAVVLWQASPLLGARDVGTARSAMQGMKTALTCEFLMGHFSSVENPEMGMTPCHMSRLQSELLLQLAPMVQTARPDWGHMLCKEMEECQNFLRAHSRLNSTVYELRRMLDAAEQAREALRVSEGLRGRDL